MNIVEAINELSNINHANSKIEGFSYATKLTTGIKSTLESLSKKDYSDYSITLSISSHRFGTQLSAVRIEEIKGEEITFDDDDKICCTVNISDISLIEYKSEDNSNLVDCDFYDITVEIV